LRALAVILVVLFHAGVPVPGGFVGVDVFFVISGYLITRLLLGEFERNGHIKLSRFWARRARRLLPASTLALAATIGASYLWLDPVARAQAGSDAMAAALFVANLWFRSRSLDYFDGGPGASPVLHYWSLSVEEQYYLVWPPLLVAMLALLRRHPLHEALRRTKLLLIGCAALSLAWFVKETLVSPVTAYYATHTRAWELAAGGLVAFGLRHGRLVPAATARWCSVLALPCLAYAVAGPGLTKDRSLFLVVPAVAGTTLLLIAGATAPAPAVCRWLAHPAPRAIGRLSYSWYLWHWPFLIFAPRVLGDPTPLVTIAVVIASLAVSAVTYAWVENPLRHSRVLNRRPGMSLALGFALILSVVLAGWTSTRVATKENSAQLIAHARNDFTRAHVDGCLAGYGDSEVKDCRYGRIDSPQRWVLWGDSHAVQWFPAFESLAHQADVELRVLGKVSCPTAVLPVYSKRFQKSYTDCLTWVTQAFEQVKLSPPGTMVFLTGYHLYLVIGTDGHPMDAFASDRALTVAFRDVVQQLLARGMHVVSLRDTPLFEEDPFQCPLKNPEQLALCSQLRPTLSRGVSWESQALHDMDNVSFIDLNDEICGPERCMLSVQGMIRWRDDNHLTATFATALAPTLERELKRVGALR
jgi:peptidoglycan/LPS O-acetylase OafA/YrhL